MSAETLIRILDETSARLATVRHEAEILEIGADHAAKSSADLAEALFTHLGGGEFTDAEINFGIMRALEGAQQAVTESCAAFGITEGPELERLLEASAAGFLDRCETLFSAPATGGAA
ncbi:hypothetical protein MKK55_11455 [Methylobacterium sp. J-059]|uniref:hypothetical protein n=1 Tax=Methylobacterium sp. J-059 TaxID=2836643 RepID=UPI001FB913E9|nr:hypothetical protein [Methylobacterium sp. J-059]MCJ2039552.1 hypothetical protein [Methylobacterium sp. J-059]